MGDWIWIVSTIAVVAGASGALIGLRKRLDRWLSRRHGRRTEVAVEKCQNCGYPLKGLDIPRCPECGALRGFKKPLDELGLTEQEVRDGFARRRREREAKKGDGEPNS